MTLDAAPVVSINSILDDWADREPDHLLFAFLDSRGEIVDEMTYEGFSHRVNTLAARLIATDGLNPGDRVILSYQPGIEIVSALFACSKAGLIAVPTPPLGAFDFVSWAGRLHHIAEDCGAVAWLACDRTLELFEEGRHRPPGEPRNAGAELLLSLPVIVTTQIATDADAKPPSGSSQIVFLQYTSGSTSNPKGVCVTHENLVANCRAVIGDERHVAVSWLPQHHDMGLIGYYINAVLSGGTTYGMSPRSFIQKPSLWLKLMSDYRATATSVPNFALELCLDERRVPSDSLDRYDLSPLRLLMVAAEPVAPETFDAFRRRFSRTGLAPEAMFVAFGLAEFTLAVSGGGSRAVSVDRRLLAQGRVKPVTDTAGVSHALPLMSCGRPLGDADIRIVDPDTRTEVSAGETGEIWVAGSSRAAGYWNKSDATRETFGAFLADETGPFVRTGDVGFVRDGEVFVCGRLKDMIIIRGQNIYPEDIEMMARQVYPELRSNGVVAFSSGEGGETSITLVAELPRGTGIPDETEIVRVIREGLQVPVARVVFVAPRSVARTSSGKVRRARTRALLEQGALEILVDTQHALSGSATSHGNEIYELQVLMDRYGINGDEDHTLFDAGIDSLDLVVFLNWIKDSLTDLNAPELAERVNPQLLSSISIRDLFAMVRLFASDPNAATRSVKDFFAKAYEIRLAAERAKMQADRHYSRPAPSRMAERSTLAATLVTGGTGFLGPFLLDALLDQTDDDIHVLVRGRDLPHAQSRLDAAFRQIITDPARRDAYRARVKVVLGDLEAPRLGLTARDWQQLAETTRTIYHNGALVNYLLSYDRMRAANVEGTSAVLDLCFDGQEKVLNHISTTFVFGWVPKDFLYENDRNDGMEKLDFGYSQSKWVAEQKVFSAMEHGLSARVFRPSLITPALNGRGSNLDITIRVLSFMIKHRLGVTAGNQISLTPADVAASNIVAIGAQDETVGGTFHVVRDDVEAMPMITDIIADRLGTRFEMLTLTELVRQMISRCTRSDPIYPLLDFLVGSVEHFSSMETKRYDSGEFRKARDQSGAGRADPPLEDVIDGILGFMQTRNLL